RVEGVVRVGPGDAQHFLICGRVCRYRVSIVACRGYEDHATGVRVLHRALHCGGPRGSAEAHADHARAVIGGPDDPRGHRRHRARTISAEDLHGHERATPAVRGDTNRVIARGACHACGPGPVAIVV